MAAKKEKGRHTYVFSGNVQKTRFRDYIATQAERLSLTGEVKNMSRDKVEAVLEGDLIDLEKFENIMRADKKRGRILQDDCLATGISFELIKEKHLGVFNCFLIGYSTSYQDELNDQFGAAMAVQIGMSRSMGSMDAKMGSMDAKMGSMDAKMGSMDAKMGRMEVSIKDSNKAIRELTSSMNTNFERLDMKYHTISKGLDSLEHMISNKLDVLPKRIAKELGKVLNA